jgi:hypothetical protein
MKNIMCPICGQSLLVNNKECPQKKAHKKHDGNHGLRHAVRYFQRRENPDMWDRKMERWNKKPIKGTVKINNSFKGGPWSAEHRRKMQKYFSVPKKNALKKVISTL